MMQKCLKKENKQRLDMYVWIVKQDILYSMIYICICIWCVEVVTSRGKFVEVVTSMFYLVKVITSINMLTSIQHI